MSKINFKRVSLPTLADADEKIKILEGHINDLQNTLEVMLDMINEKINAEGVDDVY